MFSRSTLILAIVAAVSIYGVTAQVPNCARNYTVVSGDTCDGICAKESVSTFQLENVNSATIDADCDNLFIGESLCLGIIGQDCQVVHVVASGDTCFSIVQAAGTTFDILLANNPNVNSGCTNIFPGEVLCTADDVIVVAPPTTTSTVKPTTTSTVKSTTTSTAKSTTISSSTSTLSRISTTVSRTSTISFTTVTPRTSTLRGKTSFSEPTVASETPFATII